MPKIPISSIIVPEDRQRKDLGDISSLALSIAKIGLINPIILESPDQPTLLAGERRLAAHKLLNLTSIEVTFRAELSSEERVLLELEENIRRKQLTWQEEVAAVARYTRIAKDPQSKVAKDLGISETSLSSMIRVAEAITEDPSLKEVKSWSAAYEIIRNKTQKAAASVLEEIIAPARKPVEVSLAAPSELAKPSLGEPAKPAPQEWSALPTDFIQWANTYSGPRFNLIHCDFPYGVNLHKGVLQNPNLAWKDKPKDRYSDSPEIFESLLHTFTKEQDRFVAHSAHLIFWLSMKNYCWVSQTLSDAGWELCETPFIWHKGNNVGIAPNFRMWPRRSYEVAIFAVRGGRQILHPYAASFASPVEKQYHISEKPIEVLNHFLSMLTNEFTEILDPTCGSGNALLVAKRLGAKRGLGLDIDQAHVDYTNRQLRGE